MPIPVEIQPFICHGRQNECPPFWHVLVDMAVTGQYAGPTGTAAIALVMPVWSFICSLGILTGIGGSVLYSNAKGILHEPGPDGNIGINAFSVISYLSSFTMSVFFGASKGMQPLFGQAYGARQEDDLKAYYRAGILISMAGSALCVAIYVLFPHAHPGHGDPLVRAPKR